MLLLNSDAIQEGLRRTRRLLSVVGLRFEKQDCFVSSLLTVLSTQTNSRLISVNTLAVFVTCPKLIH